MEIAKSEKKTWYLGKYEFTRKASKRDVEETYKIIWGCCNGSMFLILKRLAMMGHTFLFQRNQISFIFFSVSYSYLEAPCFEAAMIGFLRSPQNFQKLPKSCLSDLPMMSVGATSATAPSSSRCLIGLACFLRDMPPHLQASPPN